MTAIESIHKSSVMDNLLMSLSHNIDFSSRRIKTTKKALKGIEAFLNMPTEKWIVPPEYDVINIFSKTEPDKIIDRKQIQITEGVENNFKYQYDPKYQSKIADFRLTMEEGLAGVIPVAMNIRAKYIRLEQLEPPPQLPGMQPPQQIFMNQQQPGKIDRIRNFGRRAKSINELQSPSELAVEPSQLVENIEQIYRKWINYHRYGVLRNKTHKLITMNRILDLEVSYFIDTVSPAIMKIVGETQRIFIEKEQLVISSVVSTGIKQATAENAYSG